MLYESVIKLSVTKDEIKIIFNPECNLGIAYINARCYLQKTFTVEFFIYYV